MYSGSFTQAKKELRKKTLRANFKLKKLLSSENMSPKIALDLYKKVVLPVGLYGAEIWGSVQNTANFFEKCDSLPQENVLLQFAKFTLGVNRKSCNAGVRGELGLFPIYFNIIKSIIKYWNRLYNLSNGSLLKNSFMESIKLYENGYNCWFANTKIICNFLDCNKNNLCPPDSEWVTKKLRNMYIDYWKNITNKPDSKMEFYSKIKSNIGFKKYLGSIKNFHYRKAVTKIRISAHLLAIES